MSNPFNKIMLVTNEPSNSSGAEKTTLNLAKQFGASVLLVDSVRTPFKASRYPRLSTEIIYQTALDAKNKYLSRVQTQLAQEGIVSTTKVLAGHRTSNELIGTVVDNECDLVVRYMKGQSSRAKGRYGETAENLMRACPVPVLFTEKEISDSRVVACIDLDHGHEENQAVLEQARRFAGSPENLFVISCWEFTGHDFLYEYMDEGMQDLPKDEAAEMYHKMFDQLQDQYNLEDLNDQVFLFNESPITAIPKFCNDNQIDIAVMCSASLNHPLGRRLGSTIERTISDLPCALLTVKPIGFEPATSEMDEAQFRIPSQSRVVS